MVHTSERIWFTNYENLLNSTLLQYSENLDCLRETGRLLAKKELQKSYRLKVKKKLVSPAPQVQCTMQATHVNSVPIHIPTTAIVTTCYPYQQDYNYPLALSGWHPMNSPLFTIQPIPVIIPSQSPIFATHICPFAGTVIQPVVTPILSRTIVQDDVTTISSYLNEYNDITDVINQQTCHNKEESIMLEEETAEINEEIETIGFDNLQIQSDPLEIYFALPKELFPTARMMTLDPNPIIDEFCKMSNLQHHTPWLLDLEFGIPRTLITRIIPTYNVKFNSIHCKNTPDAVHPGFESCDPGFKKVFLFYYDCIVSAWYRGYIIMNRDRSVENFQSWLLLPMQVLGMCWP